MNCRDMLPKLGCFGQSLRILNLTLFRIGDMLKKTKEEVTA